MHWPCFALCRIAWSWCAVGYSMLQPFLSFCDRCCDRHSLYALVWQHLWLLAETLWQLQAFYVFDGTANALKLRTRDRPRFHLMWISTPCISRFNHIGTGISVSKLHLSFLGSIILDVARCYKLAMAMGLGCYRLLQRCSILPITELMGIIWWPLRLVFRPLRQAGLHSAASLLAIQEGYGQCMTVYGGISAYQEWFMIAWLCLTLSAQVFGCVWAHFSEASSLAHYCL